MPSTCLEYLASSMDLDHFLESPSALVKSAAVLPSDLVVPVARQVAYLVAY